MQPGWTKEENQILKLALMYHGVGRWKEIEKGKYLPSKMIQQMYLQTQRMIGQQSLAEFMGLKLDLDRIALKNKNTVGVRKMGFLVNQGDKLTKERRMELQKRNQEEYGLSDDQLAEIRLQLPAPSEC